MINYTREEALSLLQFLSRLDGYLMAQKNTEEAVFEMITVHSKNLADKINSDGQELAGCNNSS